MSKSTAEISARSSHNELERPPSMLYYAFLRGFIRFMLIFMGSRRVKGGENIPAKGPYLIVTNHNSTADTPLLYIAFPRFRLRFFAGEAWEDHWIIGPTLKYAGAIFIKRGTVDRQALRRAVDAIKGGSIFALAPEGQRSRVGALQPGRDGAAYLATRVNIPILPVGLADSDRLMANFKRLRRTRLHVKIGKPFMLPELDRRIRSRDLPVYTHLIMAHIAAQLPERHRGHYAESPAVSALLNGEDPWPHCDDERFT